MTFQTFFPLRPVPFTRARKCGSRFFNAPKYSNFKTEIGWRLTSEKHRIPPELRLPDPTVPLFVEAVFNFHKPARSARSFPGRLDTDNLLKAILDAGTGILWRDDDQIVRVVATKRYAIVEGIGFTYGVSEWL